MALAEASGLFRPHELEELGRVLADYFEGDPGRAHFWLADDGGLVSVAYCAPEVVTTGTWNLLFIAVRPDRQGEGRGTALLRHVEQTLAERGACVLLVETSGTSAFERTRAFYHKHGLYEHGRVQAFYGKGDDKVTYRKVLAR